MKSKLKLKPDATFKKVVLIPVAGAAEEPVEFEFRWRGAQELEQFWLENEERSAVDALMDCVVGWNIDAPFNRENVEIFADAYPLAAHIVGFAYSKEIFKEREKN